MQLLYYSFFHSKMLVVLTRETLQLTLVLKISIKIFFVNNWLDFALYNEILANELEFKFQLRESSWHTNNNKRNNSNNNRLTANTTTITMHTTTITMAANTTTITQSNTLNNKQSKKLNNSNNNKHTNKTNKKHNNKTNNIDWGVLWGRP